MTRKIVQSLNDQHEIQAKRIMYYNYHNIKARFGISLNLFLGMVERGDWKDYIRAHGIQQPKELVIRQKGM